VNVTEELSKSIVDIFYIVHGPLFLKQYFGNW
jgi:hypothetical protein